MYVLEIAGVLLLIACIIFYKFFPIERDRFLFGNTTWGGALLYCCGLIAGLILTISFTNHLFHDTGLPHIEPENLIVSRSAVEDAEEDKATQTAEERGTFPRDNFYAIFSQVADPGNISNAKGSTRRFAAILALLGIFCLSGLLLSSLVTLLTNRSEKWKQGLIQYNKYFDKYAVIIGVNEQTATIIKQELARDGIKYVLVQTRQNVETIREQLNLNLDRNEERHVVMYYAERTSNEDIIALHLEKALEIFVLGEDMNTDNEEDHDAFNINCLEHVSKYLMGFREQATKRVKCHVNFEYQSTFTAFKATHMYQNLDKVIEFIPFNVHEIWAKKVLVDNFAVVPKEKKGEYDVQRYYPIDSYIGSDGRRHNITVDNVGENAKSVHVIIVGMNQMGLSFGLQTALLAHYPNFMVDNSLRTTITFIDGEAKEESEYFKGRFEALFNLCRHRTVICGKDKLEYKGDQTEFIDPMKPGCGPFSYMNEDDFNYSGEAESFMDLQWEFIQGSIASSEVSKYIEDIAADRRKTTTIAICFSHPQRSIASSLYLPGAIFRSVNQVLVYQRNNFDLLNKVALGETDWKRYSNLFPFGMIESSYTGDVLENPMAVIRNFLYAKRDFDEKSKEPIKDKFDKYDPKLLSEILKSWDALGLVDKTSNIDMAESVGTKLRSMGIEYAGDPSVVEEMLKDSGVVRAMAHTEHMRWMTERLSMGFRPLTRKEFEGFIEGKSKAHFKKYHRALLGISSYNRLSAVDPGSASNVRKVINSIPFLLRGAQWLNAVTSSSDSQESKDILLREFLFHKKFKPGFRKFRFSLYKREMSMRYVPKGTFEDGGGNHNFTTGVENAHGYWIGDVPVTKWQWYLVTGRDKPARREREYPVVGVSKKDVEDFLTVLRFKTGLYFDLPSVDEWAFAARKSTGYLKHTDNWDKILHYMPDDVGRGRKTKPAKARWNARKQKNELGVYDMVGNVWEWTRDASADHEKCFSLCGGSWRFKKVDCDMGQFTGEDSGYWISDRAATLKSDDLGCRLIWKFEVIEDKSEAITSVLLSGKAEEKTTKELVEDWFKRFEMISVEEGFYIQGAENRRTAEGHPDYPECWIDENAGDDETPHHVVHITRLESVCSVPVTQELWNLVMGTNSRTNPAANLGNDNPQTNVSYRTIVDSFLPALNKMMGLEKSEVVYRLPTESEWEYLAKGAHTSTMNRILKDELARKGHLHDVDKLLTEENRYPMYSGSETAKDVAWISINSTQPVNSKRNPLVEYAFPVFNLSGNVWEWCDDFYKSTFYEPCTWRPEYQEKGYISDPECLDEMYSAHVFRGGSWVFGEKDCRCTRPNYWVDTYSDDDLGFRLVLGRKYDKKKIAEWQKDPEEDPTKKN